MSDNTRLPMKVNHKGESLLNTEDGELCLAAETADHMQANP